MFFSEMLTPDRVNEIIEERLDELHHWTEVCIKDKSSKKILDSEYGPDFLMDYAMVMMKAEIDFLKKNTDRLLNHLIKTKEK
tara:strand:+ start:1536 stop:1781 length:246 start_codon:yes stop_codon:yes gene_type:complete